MPRNLPEAGGGKVKCGILASSTGRITREKAVVAGIDFKAITCCSAPPL